jgi:hypothetical protein
MAHHKDSELRLNEIMPLFFIIALFPITSNIIIFITLFYCRPGSGFACQFPQPSGAISVERRVMSAPFCLSLF